MEQSNTPRDKSRKDHPTYGRFNDNEISHLSGAKEAELMWGRFYNKLGSKNNNFVHSEKFHKAKDLFKAVYFQVKSLFNDKYRSDGTPYFYHLLETAYILIEESNLDDLRVEDIVVALLHDIIEDTPHNFDSLWRNLSYKGREIAFGVHIISKPPFYTHIEHDNEMHQYKNCLDEIGDDNIDLSGNIIDENKIESKIVKQYNDLKEKYKPLRNKLHFENYTNYETFKEHAKKEAKELGESFSDTLLDVICKRSLNVKFADRFHNLRTISHLSELQITRKTHETRKYLLGIAQEINPIMAKKLLFEIEKLENEVGKGVISGVIKKVRDVTKESLT